MKHRHRSARVVAVVLGAALLAAGCGREGKGDAGSGEHGAAPTPSSGESTPAGSGKVVLVEMWSDGNGNYFKPSEVEVHRGDVVRFVLKAGVHNVHFLPDSNPGRTGLPPASDMLQLPEQTYDVPVTFAKGEYYYQCDPHAALGMKGRIEVEED